MTPITMGNSICLVQKRVAILLSAPFYALRIADIKRLLNDKLVLGMCPPFFVMTTCLILHRAECIRIEPAAPITATITHFPKGVPIDYFEPSFFNQMSVRERAIYMNNGVALPVPNICADLTRTLEWKNLPYDEFMKKFGEDTLKLYNLPTDAELKQLNEYDDEESSE